MPKPRMPRVSVIIPAYNHERFINDTLQSVFSQTFTDYEVIVVNDGSPDKTREILGPLRQTGRIRYFEQDNHGQAAARNRGLSEARGEFVAFLDDDDLWPCDKLQWQVDFLDQHVDAAMVAGTHTTDLEIRDKVGDGRQLEVYVAHFFVGNPFVSPGITLMRTEEVRALGGFNEQIWGADDLDLYIRLTRQSSVWLGPTLEPILSAARTQFV